MKISQDNIYRVLETVSEKGATVKEILLALSQKKKRKTQLRKTLKLLSKNKVCYKRNNRYYLHDQAAFPSPRGTRQSTFLKQKADKRYHKLENLGMILGRDRDRVIYSFRHKEEYRISRGNLRDLLQGDIVKFSITKEKEGSFTATLTSLVERRINSLRGRVQFNRKGEALFAPESVSFPQKFTVTNMIRLRNRTESRAWLDLSRQATNRQRPEGSVRLIDDTAPNDGILDGILITNKIPTRFPPKVVKSASLYSGPVRFSQKSGRFDLRVYPFVTLDGEDARDFDDAVYAQRAGENYRIWVSIADVDAYVPAGSELDREAFCRGTSTYLPGMVFPMLPEPISSGVCSLKKGVNRKTITCELLVDKRGKTLSCGIYPSMNKIACRLTYSTVDHFYKTGNIKPGNVFSGLTDHLLLCREIASVLRKKRIRSGFIDFQLPEARYIYGKNNRLIGIEKAYQTEAMQVIEQLMLLANENVAAYCWRKKLPIIWRNHPQPLPEERKKLLRLFWNFNINLSSIQTGKDYNKALSAIKNSEEKGFLEVAMLRSMTLAVYETENRGHFGLSSSHYCHFTSPIRRYPDLLVHRALKRHFRGESPNRIPEHVALTASERERLAMSAERASGKYFKLVFMSNQIGEIFQAKITGFAKPGLFIEVDSPFVEGFVPFSTIFDDIYEVDEENQCIRGRKQRTRFTIGKELKVLLTGLNWRNLSSDFDWICWNEKL